MKVSIQWLKELVEVKDIEEVTRLLPLRTIAVKEATGDYIELDMKGYNRADLLSMRGVAREVAAITDSELKFEEKQGFIFSDKEIPEIALKVEDVNLCPFYSLNRIENLSVKPSNPEWVKKLADCGIRSINNVADLTNLIMLEFGQPMHAFDADKVQGTISVRLARIGEKLLTLDGKLRELNLRDLVIADDNGPIGLAGVMGGKDTEVTDTTKTILLEAAIFDPITIRKTAQRLHLPSEASKRFQHGLTKSGLFQALDEAIRTYTEHGGKMAGFQTVGEKNDPTKTITLTKEKINSLIGVDIPKEEVEEYLRKLGFALASQGDSLHEWEVSVPYWRLDIEIEVDLVEEIARMYGYEKIPSKKLEGEVPEKIDQKLTDFIYDLKKALSNEGLTEVQTYSFFSTKVLNNIGWAPDFLSKLVRVSNPMSAETEYLRFVLWQNLLEVISKNMRAGFKDIAIFEIGKMYAPGPKEGYDLSIALMNGSDNPIEELNVILNKVKDLLRMQVSNKLRDSSATPQNDNFFHPNRFATIRSKEKVIGSLAEVHPRIVNKFGIDKRVAILEINIEDLIS